MNLDLFGASLDARQLMIRRLSPLAAITLIGVALILGVPASASADSPNVLTIDTYSTATTTATVEGILNPENQTTTYEAQYDVEGSSWCQTGTGSPAHTTTGTNPVIVENAFQPISVDLTGLTEGADYCAQLTATNGDGETDGGPVFWTQGAPTVDTNDAFATGDSTAEIDGDVNPAGKNTSYAAEYDVASSTWCTSNGASGSPAHTTGSTDLGTTDGSVFHDISVDLTGLSTGAGYCGEVVATNTDGLGEGEQLSWTQPAPPPPVTLTMRVSGSGTVTSSPAGINCSTAFCQAAFAPGTQVTLTATPAAGSLFPGWHFSGCTGAGPCTISLTSDTDIPVFFLTPPPSPLQYVSVSILGGRGTVTGSPVAPGPIPIGINCTSDGASITAGSTCEAAFFVGTQVTLTASPNTHLGSGFAGWGGSCTGTGTCTVIVGPSTTNVTASFTEPGLPHCTLKPKPKVPLKGPSAGKLLVNLQCNQDVSFSLDGSVRVKWHNKLRKATTHNWSLAELDGNAQAGTAVLVTRKLPKAALLRLRQKHLSASVAFELDGINDNGGTATTVRLKLK